MDVLLAVAALYRPAFAALLVLMVLDMAYAIVRVFTHRNQLDPPLLDQLSQKVTVLVVVNVALVVETIAPTTSSATLTSLVILFYIGVEALLILKAAVRDGVPAPKQLKTVLEGLVGNGAVKPPPAE